MTEDRTLKLMTYNLKFANPTFEPTWDIRREMQVDIFRKYQPDIIGTQEGLKEQVDYLADQLPDYVVVGEGRKGGDDDEHMALFIKRDKYRIREVGSFQLSDTPEVIGSGPENNPRMVTWARLAVINRPRDGESGPYPEDYRGHWENTEEFYVFNTHLFNGKDHLLARLSSARLIVERIKALDRFGRWTLPRPVFLMGDFNSRPGGEVHSVVIGEQDSEGKRFLDDSADGADRIDWILSRGDVKVLSYEIVEDNVDGVYASDHKPILVEYQI
jgi:endonuclease/exonuclease/phosphatase family metal-dependent hydrolase